MRSIKCLCGLLNKYRINFQFMDFNFVMILYCLSINTNFKKTLTLFIALNYSFEHTQAKLNLTSKG